MRKALRSKALVLVTALLLLAIFFQAALDRTPAGTRGNGGFPSAESLTRFLGGIRQYLAYVYFIKADKLHHTYGDDRELVAYYLLVSYLDPHYVDAYYVVSGLIYDAGRHQEALDYALRGVAANPDSADLYAALADIYMMEGRKEDAREAFEKAVALRGRFVGRYSILKDLAIMYGALGDVEGSRRLYLEAVAHNRVRVLRETDAAKAGTLIRLINEDCDVALPGGYEGGP